MRGKVVTPLAELERYDFVHADDLEPKFQEY